MRTVNHAYAKKRLEEKGYSQKNAKCIGRLKKRESETYAAAQGGLRDAFLFTSAAVGVSSESELLLYENYHCLYILHMLGGTMREQILSRNRHQEATMNAF